MLIDREVLMDGYMTHALSILTLRWKNPKLKRNYAMRLHKNKSEPRVTRRTLRLSENGASKSLDNTPTNIRLNACQNLSRALPPRRPIVPEAVVLTQAQDLSSVIPSTAVRSSGRTLRTRPRVDYFKLHHGATNEDEEE